MLNILGTKEIESPQISCTFLLPGVVYIYILCIYIYIMHIYIYVCVC